MDKAGRWHEVSQVLSQTCLHGRHSFHEWLALHNRFDLCCVVAPVEATTKLHPFVALLSLLQCDDSAQ